MLRHGAGHVHQAEHDRLGHRLGLSLEAAVADVDRIDVRDAPELGLERLDLRPQRRAALLVAIIDLALELLDRLGRAVGAALPARHRDPHGAPDRDIGGRSGDGVTGAADAAMLGLGEPPLGEVGQLEIVEEQIEKFLTRQDEAERVLAVASPASFGFPPPWLAREHIAFDELLFPGTPGRECHYLPGEGGARPFRRAEC